MPILFPQCCQVFSTVLDCNHEKIPGFFLQCCWGYSTAAQTQAHTAVPQALQHHRSCLPNTGLPSPIIQVKAMVLEPQQHCGQKPSSTAFSRSRSQAPRKLAFLPLDSQLAAVGVTCGAYPRPALHITTELAKVNTVCTGFGMQGAERKGSMGLALHHSSDPWTGPTPFI